MSKATEVNEATFSQSVLKAVKPVLVDFWAPWCGPCRMVAPVIDELSDEYSGKVEFVKVNVDDNQKIAQQYGVMSIPTLILFKDGAPVTNVVGFRPKPELKKTLDEVL